MYSHSACTPRFNGPGPPLLLFQNVGAARLRAPFGVAEEHIIYHTQTDCDSRERLLGMIHIQYVSSFGLGPPIGRVDTPRDCNKCEFRV